MPAHWRATDFAQHAGRSGISVVPASVFATGGTEPEALRLSLGVASDRDTLLQALNQLADLLSHPPSAAKAIV